MPIGTSPNRGRNPAVNSAAVVRPIPNNGVLVIVAGAPPVASRELVIGLDAGVNFGLWVMQTAGAVPVNVQPEFLYQQGQINNIADWEPIVQPALVTPLPGAGTLRAQYTQPCRRFRVSFDCAAAASLRYYLYTWAV